MNVAYDVELLIYEYLSMFFSDAWQTEATPGQHTDAAVTQRSTHTDDYWGIYFSVILLSALISVRNSCHSLMFVSIRNVQKITKPN